MTVDAFSAQAKSNSVNLKILKAFKTFELSLESATLVALCCSRLAGVNW